MTNEILTVPPAAIFIVGALLIPLFKGRVRQAYMLLIAVAAIINVYFMQNGTYWQHPFMEYELILGRVDLLSKCFGYVFTIAALAMTFYALRVKEAGEHVAAFLYIGSALGVVFAGDLITVFIFWEVMAWASVVLVWYRRTKASIDAGFRYLLVHVVGGVLLLGGIILYMHEPGGLVDGTLIVNGTLAKVVPFTINTFTYASPGAILILLGFIINAAVPPLHAWLPDAYPEATITGAVFMTAFTTKTAVYVLARGFAGFTIDGFAILMWLGAIMAIYGVVYAILENNIRRLLAYHIVSQVGYMVCGIGIAASAASVTGTSIISQTAIDGTAAHAFCHILYKGLLFMSAGAIIYMTGKSKLTELGGLYKVMPLTMILYMIAAFSISGVPLFNGFTSKSIIIHAAEMAGNAPIFLMLEVAAVGTFLSVGLKLPYFAFFGKDAGIKAKDPPANMLIGMGIAAFLCILLGVYPSLLYNILPYPEAVADYAPYAAGHLVGTLQLLLFTYAGFLVLKKRLHPENSISLDTDWFYRKGSVIFVWIMNNPLARGTQWTIDATLAVKDFAVWFSKNPVEALGIVVDKVCIRVLRISEGATAGEESAEKVLDSRIQTYPGEPVRRDPIGVSVLLGTIFLFAYLVIYVVAPHLSIYSMIGLLVVAVTAGIGMRVREMMRGVAG
ncbi:MAG: Na(+)/H(+) antiporter subunit D [Euryarchaeota archaeon]|nr:MAG: multicomponent Na+:H+ antiporter subunit D [ANME-2 cluster archaeon]MEA1865490.1 Na(+)/H(+) antiporter subunit D [Euryarchaeota archaeon]